MHFTDIKDRNQGLIKVRSRLRELKKLKKVKEEKINAYGKPKVFFKEKPKHTTLEHVINRNWGYLYLMNYNTYFKLQNVENEYVVGDVQADGFAKLYSDKGDKFSYWFVESDRVNSKNEFEKILKYNEMYKNDQYVDKYWSDNKKLRPDWFPKILIVTDSDSKKEKIEEKVRKENKEGLEFIVKTVEEIRVGLGMDFGL